MDSLRGKLLIAEPRLPDPNFFKSVVLVLEHSDKGASGLILNRPSSVTLSDIWKNVAETELGRDEPIFIGGPVEGPLAILHDQLQYSEQSVMNGINLSLKRQNLDPLLASETSKLRVFSGYSGWSSGQLEYELKSGGWLIWDAKPEHVFSDPELVYKQACDELGHHILFGKNTSVPRPTDPSLN